MAGVATIAARRRRLIVSDEERTPRRPLDLVTMLSRPAWGQLVKPIGWLAWLIG